MSDDAGAYWARLQEIETRYQALDPGPWTWRQCYGIGSREHWALESPKSAADGKVVSYLAVLHHCYPKSLGESVEDDEYLDFMARSRDDIEWLCQQLRAALQARSPWPRPDWSQAPEWAEWWAVDANGQVTWFDTDPVVDHSGFWDHLVIDGRTGRMYPDGKISIPIGTDWRLLKEKRPA